MNGIEKITSEIISDAEKYAKKVSDNCIEQCEQVRKTEQKRAELICKEEDRKFEIECAGIAERALSSARVIERNILLDAKNARIDGVFKLAGEQLTKLDRKIYFDFLEKNLKKAIELLNAPESDGFDYPCDADVYTLILNLEDKSSFGEKLLKNSEKLVLGRSCKMRLSEKSAEISGGFILSRSERELDCSFEAILRGLSQSIRREINKILFG